ncbi:MAG: hypothetical protein A3A61_02535 [Candidatus Woykebacteria bacterium RIFCSPLOWO2_01_FULL_43_14]|uniref:Uncharacterized protein n=2 Tax=Candidatus Woykeibacteriota TaxID=1817899 RepID=A0A1G1WSC3_9BACT|nr:MAG: hypothetical protein A3J50_01745 [Candidatus Woykebacteria bacterium RIFCSPHIGHO2_02_FULL_43_16b]OGY30642.1 MAG: hypothetical protein A3A61_02535 [Candidatus Woykebacteria bacterium RIFCSPLOWO2_01_FULL_43_14]
MLDAILETYKKEVRVFFVFTGLVYTGLIIALTPILIVISSYIMYLDDYVSSNQIRSLYLFSSMVLLGLFLVSSLVSSLSLTIKARGNIHLRYLYFMLFFGLLAGAALSSVLLFLVLNALLALFLK